jgi:Lrp/AsnC family transcriptional regulator, regulator for asnA, asnC and gidA
VQMNFDSERLLDYINLKIIDVLSKDSSVPFVEIAKQIGISDATVHLRVRRLRDEGIISKFTLSVDNDLLGYDHLSFIGINIRPGLADRITEELSTIEEVLEVHEMHGKYDLFVKVRAKDLNHTRDIIENKIRILSNIVDTQLMTVLKTSKEEQMASFNNHVAENDIKNRH